MVYNYEGVSIINKEDANRLHLQYERRNINESKVNQDSLPSFIKRVGLKWVWD